MCFPPIGTRLSRSAARSGLPAAAIAGLWLTGAAGAALGAERFELRVNPFADLYFSVRAEADAGRPIEATPMGPAVRAAGALGPAARYVDAVAIQCESAAEAIERFDQLPESMKGIDGAPVPIRALAGGLADSLLRVEPRFLATTWPRHQETIRAARDRLSQTLLPRSEECLRFIEAHLGFRGGDSIVPILLVAEAPRPGGLTLRVPGDERVCVISVSAHTGTQLDEVALHEAIHALDVERQSDTVLRELAAMLEPDAIAGLGASRRDVVHTLVFIQAGETVVRLLDPTHTHYGDVSGYYAKVSRVVEIERPIWIDYLDSNIDRDHALRRIAAAFAASAGDSRR